MYYSEPAPLSPPLELTVEGIEWALGWMVSWRDGSPMELSRLNLNFGFQWYWRRRIIIHRSFAEP